MTEKETLILFVKHPVPGKVKSRLAAKIGDKHAAEIYRRLLEHLKKVTTSLPFQKKVYYHEAIQEGDIWAHPLYSKHLQSAGDIGQKMEEALGEELEKSDSVVLIGSDCPEITSHIVSEAFEKLKTTDVVIGPANDGGYYLIGMKKKYPFIFRNVDWSTEKVFKQTMETVRKHGLRVELLPPLTDIDTFEDLMNTSFGFHYDEQKRTG